MSKQETVVSVGSVTTWLSGGTPDRANASYWSGSIPWISAATLKRTRVFDSDQKISAAALRAGSKLAPQGSTLVLVRGMALHREVRAGLAMRPLSFNQDVKALIPRPGIVPKYLTYSLHANRSQILELVSSAGSGTGVLDTELLKRLPIWLPGLSEQRRIVEAIDDSESAVNRLEQLIIKKQEIKYGVVQQLLTGTTRLPGFIDPWGSVRLRDAGVTYGGLTGKTKDDFGQGSANYITFMEVMAGPRLRGERLGRVRVRSSEHQNRVEPGDVLFNGSSETPEEVALASVVAFKPQAATYLNSFCFGYRVKRADLIDPFYLAFFFRSNGGRALVSSLAQGATRYNIAKTKFLELDPGFPPVNEQKAIVSLLSAVDDELALLRLRRTKARLIRQGLMEQLLSGRVRLPVSKEES